MNSSRRSDARAITSVAALGRVVLGRVVLSLVVFSLGGCSTGTMRGLPPPPSTIVLPPSTSAAIQPAFHNNALPVLTGSTTSSSVPLGPGRVSFSGVVADPSGNPVPGATVRIERLVGAGVGVLDVTTGNDGRYAVTNALAGLLRVRAWRAPDFVQERSQAFFVTAGQKVDLKPRAFSAYRDNAVIHRSQAAS